MEPIFNSKALLDNDQYNELTAELWDMYIGDATERTNLYRTWLCDVLRSYNCKRVLDAATGTGIDSEILFDEGFEVTSIDNSAQMLQKAYNLRSSKSDPRAETWTIHQANWLKLDEDLKDAGVLEKGLFDAIVLLGNSFTHLPNEDQQFTLQKIAMQKFNKVLKPGGILICDHRNYDVVLKGGTSVKKTNTFYTGTRLEKMDNYMIIKNGKFNLIVLDVFLNCAKDLQADPKKVKNFKLYGYPFTLEQMNELVKDNFEPMKHLLYGDFELMDPEKDEEHDFYCHVAQKAIVE